MKFELRSSNFEVSSPRARPRPGGPAAQHRIDLALLPSGPDAVRRLNLHRFRTAVRHAGTFSVTEGLRLRAGGSRARDVQGGDVRSAAQALRISISCAREKEPRGQTSGE